MRYRSMFAVAALALAVPLVVGADDAGKAEYPKSVQKKLYADDVRGKKGPDFHVGEWLTKEPDRKGKVVLIDFWATWVPAVPGDDRGAERVPEEVQGRPGRHRRQRRGGRGREEVHGGDDDGLLGRRGHRREDEGRDPRHRHPARADPLDRRHRPVAGLPLSGEEKLTAEIVKQVIDADPGLKKGDGEKK